MFRNFINDLRTAIQKDIYYANYEQIPILALPDSREKNFESFVQLALTENISVSNPWNILLFTNFAKVTNVPLYLDYIFDKENEKGEVTKLIESLSKLNMASRVVM